MPFECPSCNEARVEYVGTTDDAKTQLRCRLCGNEWLHGRQGQALPSHRPRGLTLAEARSRFPTPDSLREDTQARVEELKRVFLRRRPAPRPEAGRYWARYRQIFSSEGLPSADPQELKAFANSSIGARPGNMSVFNRAWNELGDAAAATKLRQVIEYLLRGPAEMGIEDRLSRLIDPKDNIGMPGFRESLLTRVLCATQPERFLPILVYTSSAGGKREIAHTVFGLDLPAPGATSWTSGRLALWSNDLLRELAGEGFADTQHVAEFLWWAKDERR